MSQQPNLQPDVLPGGTDLSQVLFRLQLRLQNLEALFAPVAVGTTIGPATSPPASVGPANVLGTVTSRFALEDHAHEGEHSFNGLLGDVTLAAGTGISITPAGQTLTIVNTLPETGAVGKTRQLEVLTANRSLSADVSKIYMLVLNSGSQIELKLPNPTVHKQVEIWVRVFSTGGGLVFHKLEQFSTEKIDNVAATVNMGAQTDIGLCYEIVLVSDGTNWWSVHRTDT